MVDQSVYPAPNRPPWAIPGAAFAIPAIICSIDMKQFFDQTPSGLAPPVPFRYCPHCGRELAPPDPPQCTSCGFVAYHNPLPAVSVLIRNDADDVLVGRRRDTPALWCLPCGYVESNENFLEAAHRETKEETGLSIRILSVVNVVSNVITPQRESLVVVLLAEALPGTPIPGDDITEIRWIGAETIPPLAFEADQFLIAEYYTTALEGIAVDPRYADCTGHY